MRTTVLLLTSMALAVLMASGVAWAATRHRRLAHFELFDVFGDLAGVL
jgi:hypothetical protein